MPSKYFGPEGGFNGPASRKRDELLDALGVEEKEQVEGEDLGQIRVGETKNGEIVASVDKRSGKGWLFGVVYPTSLENKVNENS